MSKKQIEWFFAGILLFLILLFSSEFFHTQYFLKHAESVQAVVVSQQKTMLLDQTVFRFETKHKTVLEVKRQTLKSYAVDDRVVVLYSSLIPAQFTPDVFYEIWFNSLLYISIITILLAGYYLINVCRCWHQKKHRKLQRAGNHIYTRFKAVEAVLDIKKEGRHPYQVISSWKDMDSKKTYTFKSKYLWENPVEFIMGQTITVLIDDKNKKKYLMDLSFLPEHLR